MCVYNFRPTTQREFELNTRKCATLHENIRILTLYFA